MEQQRKQNLQNEWPFRTYKTYKDREPYIIYALDGRGYITNMTDAKFCDLHESKEGSLIRVGKDAFYQIQVSRTIKEQNPKTGKMVAWTQDTQRLAACHKDFMELIAKRAKALDVEFDWSSRYKLGQVNGKFARIIHPDDLTADEKKQLSEASSDTA